ncbi:MAG: hypothetical protein ACREP7_05900, partial [Lysobacter sp.]
MRIPPTHPCSLNAAAARFTRSADSRSFFLTHHNLVLSSGFRRHRDIGDHLRMADPPARITRRPRPGSPTTAGAPDRSQQERVARRVGQDETPMQHAMSQLRAKTCAVPPRRRIARAALMLAAWLVAGSAWAQTAAPRAGANLDVLHYT